MKENKLYYGWLSVLGVFIVIGLVAIIRIFVEGHGALFHTDDRVPWTLLLAAYVFFVLTSTGVTLVASLPQVFGMKQFEPIAKRSIFIAIAALIAGFISMVMELGSPFKMVYYMISPNLASPIWWMGLFYGLLLVFLLVKFYKMHIGDWHSKFSKFLAVGTFIIEIAALSTLGLVFGLIEARPTFFGEYIQVYFLFTAFLSGLAAIMLFSLVYFKVTIGKIPEEQESLFNNIAKIFTAVIAITFVFTIWRATVGLYANRAEFSNIQFVLNSLPYQLEIFVGLMLPLGLMLVVKIRNSFTGKVLASTLVILGLALGRMHLLMAGQIVPIMPKLTIDQEILFYFPTIWEWVVSLFSFAVMFLIYTLGEKYLKLGDVPKKVA
ncbi:MAG: hypothetical protein DRI95_06410 [Bacteroidetes bacterium]|nr:MAG: hypothetical protein DRI95_06410 [Bacteroidota bacterium]